MDDIICAACGEQIFESMGSLLARSLDKPVKRALCGRCVTARLAVTDHGSTAPEALRRSGLVQAILEGA